MDAQESEIERFWRFSKAIANNIPCEDGEELGDILVKRSNNDSTELLIHLATWLLSLEFKDDEAVAILRAAQNITLQRAFGTELRRENEEIQ